MNSVTSADGTRITFEKTGQGPPLVLLHGTGVDRHVWDDVVPQFGEQFTVYAVDRRGRGESVDGGDYAIEREFEDIEAVVDAIDEPVNLLGHSYGAICLIGAVPGLSGLRRLVLYEPPLWRPGGDSSPPEGLDRMEAMAERGDKEDLLEAYYVDLLGKPERLERLRSRSDFDRRVAAAHTLPREMTGRRAFRPTPDTYPRVEVPTLLLTGTETRDVIKRSLGAADDLFANSTVGELDGQGHGAMNTAPDLFVSEVVEFLDAE